MANAPEFDFGEMTGSVVARIKEAKVVDVPEPIKRAAQRSLDGVPHPTVAGRVDHILEHEFATEAQAAQAAKYLKLAGPWTTPQSSVRAVIDPYSDASDPADPTKPHPLAGNKKIIRWKAGGKTGAK